MDNRKQTHDVCPKVVRADCVATLVISALPGVEGFEDGGYEVTCVPSEEHSPDWRGGARPEFRVEDGRLVLRHRFSGEQEHLILVRSGVGERDTLVAEVHVYSLAEDRFALRPYKGDVHMHSDRSDGKDSPAHVAAACRRIGLDFMALTDHRQYQPSLDAIAAFTGVPVDLAIYPGEEVHPPENRVHMVNFGGGVSVNALFKDEAAYRAGVAVVEDDLGGGLSGHDRYVCASCVWCYRQIRNAGGLGIFCHPYWQAGKSYNVPEPLIARHFEDQPFDAYEVIGGHFLSQVESNILQVARYQEERSRGRSIPIVGASDAHGCETGELFGWYYTIVFAPSTELSDLIGAIKGLRSVAVEALPGETERVHGPWRLVKYARFLIREFFPAHDALCAVEGEAMQAHVDGDTGAAGRLAGLAGQTGALFRAAWDTGES